METVTVTSTWLKELESLEDVPEEQLQWFIDNSYFRSIPDGELLFNPGNTMLGTIILISGKMRLYLMINGQKREMAEFVPGDITGYLPFSRAKASTGYGMARGDSEVMIFPYDKTT